MINYGKALKETRNAYNLTQTELANAINLRQSNISAWEKNTNTPSIEACVLLADFYGITLDELIGREPPKPKTQSEIKYIIQHNTNVNIFEGTKNK